jgi:hypothetical protein
LGIPHTTPREHAAVQSIWKLPVQITLSLLT